MSLITILSCANESNNRELINKTVDNNAQAEIVQKFINPPIEQLNIPLENYSISAEIGGRYKFLSGASVEFPSNAFIDENGELIKGQVQLYLREFIDPLDFFIAGIPMTYDYSGTEFTFESSGMFEILANQENKPVFVNPNSKPILNLAAQDIKANDNIYFLDTVQEKWVLSTEKLSTSRTFLEEPSDTSFFSEFYSEEPRELLKEPVKPIKASGNQPTFTVFIPYANLVPELGIFENTKFEIDESEKNYDPKEADNEWDKVDLEKTETDGVYLILFSSSGRTVSYRVRPVYEGEDFSAALEVYADLKREYEIKRLAIIEQQKLLEAKRKKDAADRQIANEVNSQFEINSFGIWNCDRIIRTKTIQIVATFLNSKDQPIELTYISMASKELNGLFRFFSNNIKVAPNVSHVIWGISNKQLYYFTYGDFQESSIDTQTSDYTFSMREYDGDYNNYEELKTALEL